MKEYLVIQLFNKAKVTPLGFKNPSTPLFTKTHPSLYNPTHPLSLLLKQPLSLLILCIDPLHNLSQNKPLKNVARHAYRVSSF